MANTTTANILTSSESKKPGLRRLTSSSRQPHPKLPPPPRLRKKPREDPTIGRLLYGEVAATKQWTAAVKMVRQCSLIDFKPGNPMNILYQYDPEQKKQRCFLECKGDFKGLEMSVLLTPGYNKPATATLREFEIPTEDVVFDLRLFDIDRSMEIGVKPRQRRKSETSPSTSAGERVVVFFADHNDSALRDAKLMLRRLESSTRPMPNAWIDYRNYSARPPNAADNNDEVDAVVESFAGGFQWKFTGCLASKGFRDALAAENQVILKPEVEKVPGRPVTRSQTGLVETGAGKKAQGRMEKKERRLDRVLAQVSEEEEAQQPSSSHSEADGSDEYDIKGILQKRKRGRLVEYLVQWEDDTTTWVRSGDVSQEAIQAYEASILPTPTSRGRGGTGRGRDGRRGRGRSWAIPNQ